MRQPDAPNLRGMFGFCCVVTVPVAVRHLNVVVNVGLLMKTVAFELRDCRQQKPAFDS